jgi:hypothetical protein
MKIAIFFLTLALTSFAFADSFKIVQNAGPIGGKSSKEMFSKVLSLAKEKISKKCVKIDGEIQSWEIFLNPTLDQESCAATVTGICEAQL